MAERQQSQQLNIIIIGLSITSSWGNGHATTYRGLVRELAARGHSVLFLEDDKPWYAANRDLPCPPYGRTELYAGADELKRRFESEARAADLIIVGSYVPQGVEVGEWVTSVAKGLTAFYDIDTPVTMARLERGDEEYLSRQLIPRYDMYLSFTGGPIIERLMHEFGSPLALPLYCSFDPQLYYPENSEMTWDLGYLGTYSRDRQAPLDKLMLEPARRWRAGRFVVAGPQYPPTLMWPENTQRIDHLPPSEHRTFYGTQRYTLNITRTEMAGAGYCPSVRLFEAAACGAPIISDWWEGLDILFKPDREILISRSSEDTLRYLLELSENERLEIGQRARERVMESHTAAHRAAELEGYALEVLGNNGRTFRRARSQPPIAA